MPFQYSAASPIFGTRSSDSKSTCMLGKRQCDGSDNHLGRHHANSKGRTTLMAEELIFSCECGFGTSVWDEGNPYSGPIPLPGETRKTPKHYVYHPHSDAEFAIGNDRPHICLSCCHHFNVDSVKPRTKCAKCKSEDIVDIRMLGGRICPKCKVHTLRVDSGAIS